MHSTHKKNSINKRAFSLIEAAIVLAIVGLVIGGLWAAAASVQRERRLNKIAEQVPLIIENLRRLYAGHDLASTPVIVHAGSNPAIWNKIAPTDLAPELVTSTAEIYDSGIFFSVLLNQMSDCRILGPRLGLILGPTASIVTTGGDDDSFHIETAALAQAGCQYAQIEIDVPR